MVEGLVSVIIPVYNRQDYIAETLDSVINQTYSNLEIITINDGSSDDSEKILREYESRYPDKIVLVNQHNQGQVKARNNGLKISKGEYIAFLDSDDIWMPDKIAKQLQLFTDNVGLVYSGVKFIDSKGNITGIERCDKSVRNKAYDKLLVRNRMTGGTVVIKADVLNKVGYFDENLKAAENWDLWLRIAKDYDIDFVDEALLKYRKHDDNMSCDKTLMLDAVRIILEKHCLNTSLEGTSNQACKIATANYYYRIGVYLAKRRDYTNARVNFRKAKEIVPNYLDCNIRIFRSYLGGNINNLITKLTRQIRASA